MTRLFHRKLDRRQFIAGDAKLGLHLHENPYFEISDILSKDHIVFQQQPIFSRGFK